MYLDLWYVTGIVLRTVTVTILLEISFGLLAYLQLAEQVRLGIPIFDENRAFLEIFVGWLFLLGPVAVAVLLVECLAILLMGMRASPATFVVVVPATLAGFGALFGLLVIVDPDDPVIGLSERMLLLGVTLQFFLAGSFQWWLWHQWMRTDDMPTPIGWYGFALTLAGAFLGSMMAWQAPSPYMQSTVRYYDAAWRDRPTETLPLEPTPDVSTF